MTTILQKDLAFLGRDIPPVPIEITSSKGSYLFDHNQKYIDFLMGWNVGNVGWGNKEIYKKIRAFDGPDYVNPNYLYKPWAELAEMLSKISPVKSGKVFRATGGTEAVEIALQAAMIHTGRAKFISVDDGYHGHSIGAMSIGLSDFRKQYKNLLPGCSKISPPLNKEAANKVKALLSKGDIAAYISEPIVCNLGVEVPINDYFQIIQQACKNTGTVFIIDEVATGFGRTGKMFASEHFGIQPDIICLGKGLSGGYGALGATVITEAVAKSFEFPFSFYSTFGWHPLNVHATLANLQFLLKNKEKLLNNVDKMSKYFEGRLFGMQFPTKTKIKIKGLAIGIYFEKEGYGAELVNKCLKKGLLFSELDTHHITFFPSLLIDKKTARAGLDILESCI